MLNLPLLCVEHAWETRSFFFVRDFLFSLTSALGGQSDGFLAIETDVLGGDVDAAGGSAELGGGTLARGWGTCSHPLDPGPWARRGLKSWRDIAPPLHDGAEGALLTHKMTLGLKQ